ncbi:MAG: ferredoxin [Candidatus Limnocylindria bacterium]
MTVDATVDPELCIGSGDCTRVAPAAFRLDELEGVSVTDPAGVAATDVERLLSAARGCPTQAIRITRGADVLHEGN